MTVGPVVRRAAQTLAAGVLGVSVVGGFRRLLRAGAVRNGAVVAASWTLRGKRSMEAGAESARLAMADVVSEARERIGEQSPPPGAGTDRHDHDHEH
ncbi:DUF1490 family protein [Rugosimonospora africana]|uniref:DUF1490 family protein n=1 Tax=Rugosimonospora africana TaxID=556532 RepID=A0A8J3VRM5_9ACTN|nr:DUF1490 family protein [Rugosimonospora africana]GIH15656.1 hypothetical protein Raf01_38280 [Rugosimonospora africana]